MDLPLILISTVSGALIGGMSTWMIAQSRTLSLQADAKRYEGEWIRASQTIDQLNGKLELTQAGKNQLEVTLARMTAENQAAADKIKLLEEGKKAMAETFEALSSKVLQSSTTAFLTLAEQNFQKLYESNKGEVNLRHKSFEEFGKQLKENMTKMDEKLQLLEKARTESFTQIQTHLEVMTRNEAQLKQETQNLVKALRKPDVRGRWGEIQLKKVVELAGMTEYCDFVEQPSLTTDEKRVRPDMIIRLPNERHIVVDAKAPLAAYLEAIEADSDEDRNEKLRKHAQQVREQVIKLSQKQYWKDFNPTPDFVVMFLPGECFYNAALQHDPELLEYMARNNVILTSPTSLIALLRTIASGWQEQKMTRNAEEIREMGTRLYNGIVTFSKHLVKIRKGLADTTQSFNMAVGSLNRSVIRPAEKLRELGISSENELPEIVEIDDQVRQLDLETDTILITTT